MVENKCFQMQILMSVVRELSTAQCTAHVVIPQEVTNVYATVASASMDQLVLVCDFDRG